MQRTELKRKLARSANARPCKIPSTTVCQSPNKEFNEEEKVVTPPIEKVHFSFG